VLGETWGDVQKAAGAMERVGELLDARPGVAPPANPIALPQPPRGDLAFENVTFVALNPLGVSKVPAALMRRPGMRSAELTLTGRMPSMRCTLVVSLSATVSLPVSVCTTTAAALRPVMTPLMCSSANAADDQATPTTANDASMT